MNIESEAEKDLALQEVDAESVVGGKAHGKRTARIGASSSLVGGGQFITENVPGPFEQTGDNCVQAPASVDTAPSA